MAYREWKNHKYIRKEGNRYIYPEDLKSNSNHKTSLTRLLSDANKELAKRTGATGAKLYDHGGKSRRDNMDIALMEEMGVDPNKYSKKERNRAYRNWVTRGAAAEKEERIQQQKAKEERSAAQNRKKRSVNLGGGVSVSIGPAKLGKTSTTSVNTKKPSKATADQSEKIRKLQESIRKQTELKKSIKKKASTIKTKAKSLIDSIIKKFKRR